MPGLDQLPAWYSKAMSMTKAITLLVNPADYERLEAEAERLGVAPTTLVQGYVRAGLSGKAQFRSAKSRQTGLAALRGLAELRQRLSDDGSRVDVVEIIAEGREERDQAQGG